MSEINNIMSFLGRRHLDGEVRGSHLGQILMYLKQTKTESLKSTLRKLTLVCGMQKRYVRENYIEGLVEFGIIHIMNIKNEVVWQWVGEKAFDGTEKSFMEHVEEKKKKEKVKKNDK